MKTGKEKQYRTKNNVWVQIINTNKIVSILDNTVNCSCVSDLSFAAFRSSGAKGQKMLKTKV